MRCAYHPDREPVGACVECGRLICVECKATLGGRMYCTPCADKKFAAKGTDQAVTPPAPPPASPAVDRSPPTGNPEAVAASTTAVAERPSEKPPKRKLWGRGWLIALAILVIILGGGWYWYKAPDMPPLRLSGGAAWESVKEKLPFVRTSSKPLPPLTAQEKQALDVASQNPLDATEIREAQLSTQLKNTGVPIKGAYILDQDNGEKVLAMTVNFQDILGGLNPGAGVSGGVQAIEQLANSKIGLSGLNDVTMLVEDSQGRILFEVSAPVSAIEQFRAKRIGERELIRSIGFSAVSRAGIMDALKQGVGK